jgi:hypothetical protein
MQNRTNKHDKPTTTPDDGETLVADSGNNATITSGTILPIADNVDDVDSDESYDNDATRERVTRETLHALSSRSAVGGTRSAPDSTHGNEHILPDVGKIEREMNVLTLNKVRANQPQVTKSIFDGLVRWVELKRFAKLPKWKTTNDVHATKAHLIARGYKDAQAYDVNTYASFRLLLGATAWLTQTMLPTCIYVAFLQKQAENPTGDNVKKSNRLSRWIKSNLTQIRIRFHELVSSLRLASVSDSAFKAQEYEDLAMRGDIIILMYVRTDLPADIPWECVVLNWFSKRHTHVVRSTVTAEPHGMSDSASAAILLNAMWTEIFSKQKLNSATIARMQDERRFQLPMDLFIKAKSVRDATAADPTKGDRSVALTRSGRQTKDSIDEVTCGSNLETARVATEQIDEGATVSHHGTPATEVVLRGSLEKTSSDYEEGSADEVRH